MSEKYIVHFVSKTKNNMIKFIENEISKNNMDDIIPSHGNILTALYESDKKLTMKEISKKIGKDKSTVTSLINKLIDLGYVVKEKSTEDKRVTFISLTNKAIKIREKYDKVCKAVNSTAYQDFSCEEKKELLRLLKKLNTNFKNKL